MFRFLLINFVLIVLSVLSFIYFGNELMEHTYQGIYYAKWIAISSVLMCVIFLVLYKKARTYSIGILFIFISSSLFFIFKTNQFFGKEKRIQVKSLGTVQYIKDNTFFRSILFENKKRTFPIEYETFFDFDSVEIIVNQGLFGIIYFTDQTFINPSQSCKRTQEIPEKNRINYGLNLIQKRCFNQSIDYFTALLSTNDLSSSTKVNCLHYRGLNHLFLKEYEKAENDFELAIKIGFAGNENIDQNEIQKMIDDYIKSKNSYVFVKKFANYFEFDKLRSLIEGVQFCNEKING